MLTQFKLSLSTYNNWWQYNFCRLMHSFMLFIHCVQKRDRNFFVISPIKLGDSDEIWYNVSWINLLQNNANVSHLAWIMSLHYLVKLEMLMARMLPLRCYRKKLQNLSHLNCGLNCGLQIRQILIQFLDTLYNNVVHEVQVIARGMCTQFLSSDKCHMTVGASETIRSESNGAHTPWGMNNVTVCVWM